MIIPNLEEGISPPIYIRSGEAYSTYYVRSFALIPAFRGSHCYPGYNLSALAGAATPVSDLYHVFLT